MLCLLFSQNFLYGLLMRIWVQAEAKRFVKSITEGLDFCLLLRYV